MSNSVRRRCWWTAAAAEHAALHRYLVGILRDGQHRAPTVAEYQDLVGTHDQVCHLMGADA